MIAIALLCITPNGTSHQDAFEKVTVKTQKECHSYYADCALKWKKISRADSILQCMKDRK